MDNLQARESLAIKQLVGAAFFYSLFSVFSRLIGDQFAPFYQAWSRAIPTLIILVIIGSVRKSFKKIRSEDWIWFIVVGASASFVNAPFFLATVNIPLGMTMFIFYASNTLMMYLLGSLFLKEQLTVKKVLAIFLAFGGLASIYFDNLRFAKLEYMALAALAGAFYSIYATLSKKISNRYSSEQINILDYIITLITYFLISFVLKERPYTNFVSSEWLWNMLYSVATVGAVLLTVEGFKHIEAQKGSIILLTELIFVLFFGYLLFREVPSLNSVLGGILILLALIIQNVNLTLAKVRQI